MPYMSVETIDQAVDHILATYPAIVEPVTLPENSVEGRTVKAIRIANGTDKRNGVLFLGGTHARELINPETVVSFALRLCDAYTHNTGLSFGPKSYDASIIQTIVDGMDLFLVPMVNPDGRHHCLTPGGDAMWRKNRSNHPGLPCRGVDINRNYDFLWSSGIGTTSNSCVDTFKGPSAFSEPETRNVRWMIDHFPNIACMIDIHSFSELILYPWGDDANQSTDPNQNFRNAAFDGQRGFAGGYREYMPARDLHAHVVLAERMRDSIGAVRGRVYTVQQSILLYPTSATAHDYAYARYFVDTGRRRILGFTIECAREFQPADAEKNNVITEVSAGLMECMTGTFCPSEVVQDLAGAIFPLQAMRNFRDRHMLASAAGGRYERMFREHAMELIVLAEQSKTARNAGVTLMRTASRFFTDKDEISSRKIGKNDIAEVASALAVLRKEAGKALKTAINSALADLKKLEGRSLAAAFKVLDKKKVVSKTKSSAESARQKPAKKRLRARRIRRQRR